jgi:hypothetical protein
VRYVAPVTGDVFIASMFGSQDVAGTTTDVHLLLNGASVFDDFVEGIAGTSTVSFSRGFSLNSGDTLDFAVGFGRNRSFFNDSTALAATIQAGTPTPEPATLLLCSTGALILYSRRRKASRRTSPGRATKRHGRYCGAPMRPRRPTRATRGPFLRRQP